MPDFPKVQSGDSLAIRADVWNAVLDSARDYAGRERGTTGGPVSGPAIPRAVVRVRNATGVALAVGHVVKIADASLAVDVANPSFNSTPVFDVEEIDAADNALAVMLEPVADEAFGRACIQGVAIALVDVGDVGHGYASAVATEYKLTSGATGSVRLLSVPAGTGEQSVAVLLSGAPSGTAGDGFTAVAARYVTSPTTVTITTPAPTQLLNCGDTVAVLDGGFDTGGFFVGDLFTVPSDGYYLCGMQGELYSPSTPLGAYPVMITFQQWAPVSYGPILMIEYVLTDGLDRATFNCCSLHYLGAGERYRPYITCNDTSLHPFDVEVSQFRSWMIKMDAVGAGSGGGSVPDGVGSYAGYSRFGSV